MKKIDDLAISKSLHSKIGILNFRILLACPPSSFFYNGSCYFYLPPKQTDDIKGIGFTDVSMDEGRRGIEGKIHRRNSDF